MKNSKGKEFYDSVLKGIATKASETCDYLFIKKAFEKYPQFTITQSKGRYCNYDGMIFDSVTGDIKCTYEAKGRSKKYGVRTFHTTFIDVEKVEKLLNINYDPDGSTGFNDKRVLYILYPKSNVILAYNAKWVKRTLTPVKRMVADSIYQGEEEKREALVYEIPIPEIVKDENGNWQYKDPFDNMKNECKLINCEYGFLLFPFGGNDPKYERSVRRKNKGTIKQILMQNPNPCNVKIVGGLYFYFPTFQKSRIFAFSNIN